MTVEQLMEACKEQIKQGNGNKTIWISDDDEGNGYHELGYTFTADKEEVSEICDYFSIKGKKRIIFLG